ncbi:MAG: MFS transporter, partial [Myxococcota bacterium]|nr:MFS transporter [Myxococcota bacterium]
LLAFNFGWQSAFVAAGLVGLLWLALWMVVYDVPERSNLTPDEAALIQSDVEAGAPQVQQPKMPWLSILRYRQAWSFIVGKFLTDPVWWFFLIWLPDYFKKTRGLDLKSSWVHLVSIYAIVTVLSIIGGWFAGYLTRRGFSVSRARKTAMFTFALLVLPILAVTEVGDWGAVLLIGLAGAAHQAWSANLFTTVSDMFPNNAVASVVGIGGMAGSVGGILFPIVAGKVLDRFTAENDVTTGYAFLFGFCGVAYLLAFAISHLLAPKFVPVEMRRAG